MGTENLIKKWSTKDAKSLTEDFIDHVYYNYYESYKSESEYYEKLNNRLFAIVTSIGFLVTIIIGLKEILLNRFDKVGDTFFTITAFVLPSISSIILLYMNQKGYKRKEELREDARIQCKFLVNEAKIRFSAAKDNVEFENIYKWLNEETKQLQLNQTNGYFVVHNNTNLTTQTD
jgi:uncharacterized membrane protein